MFMLTFAPQALNIVQSNTIKPSNLCWLVCNLNTIMNIF